MAVGDLGAGLGGEGRRLGKKDRPQESLTKGLAIPSVKAR